MATKQGPSVAATVVVAVLLCCVVCVVAEVELVEGTKPMNKDSAPYKDCNGLLKAGHNMSGVYKLHLNSTTSFLIRCEFTKGGAYNVIQRRMNGNVNFMQPLAAYIRGFGFAQTNYWAGLDVISHLTLSGNRALTIYLQDRLGSNRNAHYIHFMVQPQNLKYQMTAAGFSGLGILDDLTPSSGMPFHTYDVPDPNNCAVQMKAGWWYNNCAFSLLNGYYYQPGYYVPGYQYFDGMYWESFGGYNNSLKFVSMSVSP
eukprot:TRINITY_DN23530_c0_g2_i1.p1 TRINITY_DN23530_c0_g2~~TRINITY_DN23530_c0_g2_i1.p1  ORF type:complete len:256 (-),score=47.63 TRINITY_DN23530_c0_g2_i1:316-1083(-)